MHVLFKYALKCLYCLINIKYQVSLIEKYKNKQFIKIKLVYYNIKYVYFKYTESDRNCNTSPLISQSGKANQMYNDKQASGTYV